MTDRDVGAVFDSLPQSRALAERRHATVFQSAVILNDRWRCRRQRRNIFGKHAAAPQRRTTLAAFCRLARRECAGPPDIAQETERRTVNVRDVGGTRTCFVETGTRVTQTRLPQCIERCLEPLTLVVPGVIVAERHVVEARPLERTRQLGR